VAAVVRLAVASAVRVWVLAQVQLGGGLLLPAALVRLAVASAVRLKVLAAVRLGGGRLLQAALVRLAVASAVHVWVLAPRRLGGGLLVPAALVRLAFASAVRVWVLAAVRLGGGLLLPAALVRLAVASAMRLSVVAPVLSIMAAPGPLFFSLIVVPAEPSLAAARNVAAMVVAAQSFLASVVGTGGLWVAAAGTLFVVSTEEPFPLVAAAPFSLSPVVGGGGCGLLPRGPGYLCRRWCPCRMWRRLMGGGAARHRR